MAVNSNIQTLIRVYESAYTVETKKGRFTTVNELTDQTPALSCDVLAAAISELTVIAPIPHHVNKILSEDDKGAILAGIMAYRTGLSLAMARKYPYRIPGSPTVQVDMEYDDFATTINGVEFGDRLLIIDDTLASGGTVAGLIEAATAIGAIVTEVRVVTEKLGYGGREKLAEYRVDVKAVLGIRVDDEGRITVEQSRGVDL